MLRPRRSRRWRAALPLAALLVVVAAALVAPGTLMAAPAVLLLAALVAGFFPGATVLDRLRRLPRRAPRRAPRSSGARRPASRTAVRGGALLGLHLAGNAPPRSVALAS